MSGPLEALQTVLFARLSSDSTLASLLGSEAIFETVPEGAKPPFLTLAQHDIFARDTGDLPGFRHLIVLNAWSHSGGRLEIVNILQAARAAIESTPLLPEAYELVLIRTDKIETRQNIRAHLWKGALSLTVITEPT